jgi:hypothetical protein
MALKMSPISRNLHAKVTLLGLELEDMLFLAVGVRDRHVGRAIPLL